MEEYILIVEDDNDINQMLRDLLTAHHYKVKQAFSGTEALMLIEQQQPQAVILDLMLPGMNGEELLAHIKERYPDIVVLVASAKEDVKTKVNLLRSGAEDFISKPFDTEELLARLEVVLRRNGKESFRKEEKDKSTENVLQYKDIVMEPENFKVMVAGEEVKLTKREFMILELLMQHPEKVFTKNNIYESVWNEEFLGEENAVNVHISNIRQKLAKVNSGENYIQTVWGIGFKMQ
ncbi:MAG: response regulator transcription factor [Clostridiales bacterium]|nr:response regulator transcription factor [Clostridiales bacterium]